MISSVRSSRRFNVCGSDQVKISKSGDETSVLFVFLFSFYVYVLVAYVGTWVDRYMYSYDLYLHTYVHEE